jgi:cyclase
MAKLRLIARLDVKGPNLIKGVRLEGLRVMGDPHAFALKYYQEGADELIYMDIVASLYGRNNLVDVVRKTSEDIFIPLTVGGGVRSVEDANRLLRAGADKIALNTAATENPELISQIADRFGSQCVVVSIEAKKVSDGRWEAYTNTGRDHTGLDVVEWAIRSQKLGAGEILLTSVDQEGTRLGFDVDLVRQVATQVSIPVIASGGMGEMKHLSQVVREGHADAVAVADVIHYNRMTLSQIKSNGHDLGMSMRSVSQLESL